MVSEIPQEKINLLHTTVAHNETCRETDQSHTHIDDIPYALIMCHDIPYALITFSIPKYSMYMVPTHEI